ncbi:hypothetical protein Tco_0972487 [Tanacetum coccineum]
MFAEKKYPLKKEILEKMINLKIEAEEERKEAKVFERILSKSKSFNSRNLRFKGESGLKSIIQLQDYSLWEIIEEGNSFKPVAQTTREADGTSTNNNTWCCYYRREDPKEADLKPEKHSMMTHSKNPKSKRQKKKTEFKTAQEDSELVEASPKAMLAIDGTGFDWSYMDKEEASTNFSLRLSSEPEYKITNLL